MAVDRLDPGQVFLLRRDGQGGFDAVTDQAGLERVRRAMTAI